MPTRAIFLVGFMGAGKTSVGSVLAKKLSWKFNDLDDWIQNRAGCTIQEIFDQSGETAFRRHETSALREVLSGLGLSPTIVALGGGALVEKENVELLEQSETTLVFLNAPIEDLYQRCQRQELKRPMRQDESQFRKLYESRHPLYLRANLHIETAGKEISAIATEIIDALKLQPGNGSKD